MCFTSSQHGWLWIVFHFRHGDRLGERKQGKRNREDWEGRPGRRQPSLENRAHTPGLPSLLPAGSEVLSHQAEDLPQTPSELGCLLQPLHRAEWSSGQLEQRGLKGLHMLWFREPGAPHFSSQHPVRLTSYPVFQAILGGLGTDPLARLFW